MGSGDIVSCGSWASTNANANADLIRGAAPDFVYTAGDNAYDDGTLSQYQTCYDPVWGSFKAKTYPTPGNHEYHTAGAQGYVDYFGTAKVKNTADGGTYYAKDLGNGWRYYALNSEVPMSAGSAQETWLKADLAAHPGMHFVAAWHRPRYNSGTEHGGTTSVCPLWNDLMAARADIVLTGHEHHYERFAKMDCAGNASASGLREFMTGSGGNQIYTAVNASYSPAPQVRNLTDFGVLKLSLSDGSYTWQFLASGRQWDASTGGKDSGNKGAVLDSGTTTTHSPATGTTPTPAPTATATPTPTSPPPTIMTTTGSLDRRVSASSDDAEQNVSSGAVDLASSDLEFVTDGTVKQAVGIRFANLTIPKGARITNAYVEFAVDELGATYPTNLTIKAEASDSAPTYASTSGNVTSRATGAASVPWSVTGGWETVGPLKRTPNVATLVQQTVDRTGWASGNALAVQLTGTGHVVAQSHDRTSTLDPVLHVDYTTAAPPPTATATPTPAPIATATAIATPAPAIDPNFPTSRSKYRWPFTAGSIWNMPIGSGAVYADAGLKTSPQAGTQPDEEYLGLDPAAPLKTVASGDKGVLGQAHVPSTFSWDGRWNGSAAFLRPDGDTVWQGQPLVLSARRDPSWAMTYPSAPVSLSQDAGTYGAHGGSGLSTVGGSIRDGELSSPDPIRHALKMEIDCRAYCYFAGVNKSHRWPAVVEDDPVNGTRYGGTNPKLMPGALLALPKSFDVSRLTTGQGRKVAQAMKDYGAYMVDETAGDYYAFGVEIKALDEWHAGRGWYPGTVDPAVSADFQKMYPALKIIDNNGPTAVGGGGTPLVQKAPPFN